MAFDTRDDRAGAQGAFLLPLHPDPDGAAFSQEDRQMVLGVYPNILASLPPVVDESDTAGYRTVYRPRYIGEHRARMDF